MTSEKLKNTIGQFWETIPTVWGKVRGYTRSLAASEYNITLIQFHVLRHIYHGAHTVREIAERQQIRPPAISLVVDQLVQKNMVIRMEDQADRRYVHLDLTHEGENLLNLVFDGSRAWMAEKMNQLTIEELDTITSAMTILRQTFNES